MTRKEKKAEVAKRKEQMAEDIFEKIRQEWKDYKKEGDDSKEVIKIESIPDVEQMASLLEKHMPLCKGSEAALRREVVVMTIRKINNILVAPQGTKLKETING